MQCQNFLPRVLFFSRALALRYRNFWCQIYVLNGLQQRCAFRHWALEGFAA